MHFRKTSLSVSWTEFRTLVLDGKSRDVIIKGLEEAESAAEMDEVVKTTSKMSLYGDILDKCAVRTILEEYGFQLEQIKTWDEEVRVPIGVAASAYVAAVALAAPVA